MAGGAIDPDDPFAPWDTTRAATLPYRGIDRPRKPVGMVVWGVLLCLGTAGFGCFAGFTPLMLALPATDRPPTAQVVGIAVLYLALAAGCLALAIACLRGRRWTRKVMLALAWPALIVATLTLPVMIFSAATIEVDPATPAAGRTAALAGTAFVGLAGIALSGALILYFGRRTLADQLVAYDSRPSWTDGLPTAVLSLGLCVALAAASFALAAVTAVTPLFGTILRGPPAVALLLTEAVILAAGAWLLFKNRRAGWGVALVVAVFTLSSQLVTAAVLGGDAAATAALPREQVESMRNNPVLRTEVQVGLSGATLLVTVGLLLWIRPRVGRPDSQL